MQWILNAHDFGSNIKSLLVVSSPTKNQYVTFHDIRKMERNKRQIEYFLNFFDICGFISGRSNLFWTRKAKNIITCVHILLAVLFTINQYVYFNLYSSYFESFEIISELVEGVMSLCTYYFIILDANLYRRTHKYFWDILWCIDKNFRHRFFCNSVSIPRNFTIKFLGFGLFTILLFLRYILFDFLELFTMFIYFILVKICQIRVLYYLFCMEVINCQSKNIAHGIMEIQIIAANHMKQPVSSFDMQRFKWIRWYFYYVYDMVNALNDVFGWSQVALISISFYCAFTEFNYLFIHFRDLHADEICGINSYLIKY